ncbi:MAG: beta strand repeat-containing protein [Verrucomicrobiaceae bacterium]
MIPKYFVSPHLLAVFSLSSLVSSLSAQIAWNGPSGGDYATDGNWVGGVAPANDLTSDIAQFTGLSVNLSADRSVGGLDIASATTLTGTGNTLTVGTSGFTGAQELTLSGGVTLTINTVAGTVATGNVTIDGATVAGNTNTTQGWLGSGTITLDNGGTITGAGSHVNMRETTSIILGSGGGTFSNANARAFYGLDSAVISGVGQLTLDGGGSTNYAGNSRIQIGGGTNTYTGGTLITNKANVQVGGDENFGNVAGKVTIDDARMVTEGNTTFVSTREFEIASGGGRISLNNKTPTIAGLISGTGALTIDGQIRDDDGGSPGGTLTLSNTGNTHSGGMTIDGVTVLIGDGTSLGSGAVTLDNGALIRASGGHTNMQNASIVLGAGGGTFQNNGARAFYNVGAISGSGLLTLDGNGSTNYPGNSRIQLNNSYTYTGDTLITNKANAVVYTDGSFGADNTKVTIDDGRLITDANVSLTHEIEIGSGGGTIALGGRTSNILGALTGTGALEINGQNRDNDDGTPNGELRLTTTGTLAGAVTVRENILVRMGADNALGTGTVTVDEGATLMNHTNTNTALDNSVVIGSTGAKLSAGWSRTLTLAGSVSGSGDLAILENSGEVILSNSTHTYSGTITVGGDDVGGNSMLTVNGDISSSLGVNVESGATIGGTGTLSDLVVKAGGNINPGNSPGVIKTSDFTLAGTYNAEIAGTGSHDQIDVTGAVDVTGGTLNLVFSGSYVNGDEIFILVNDGADAVTGTFSGLSEGAIAANYGGFDWKTSYVAGDGNDISLMAVPEPSVSLLAGLGALALLRRRSRA